MISLLTQSHISKTSIRVSNKEVHKSFWIYATNVLRIVVSYLSYSVDWLDSWHGFDCGSVFSLGERC